jgi:hypothetical protein
MHWEKVPLQIADKDVLKEQINSLDNDIPIRLVRLRQKDEMKYYIVKSWSQIG